MEQATEFLMRFQRAETIAEKEAIANEYKLFHSTLKPEQQKQATAVMQALWPSIRQKVDEIDELLVKAKERLHVPVHK